MGEEIKAAAPSGAGTVNAAILVALCVSGAAALIYEVAWMRALSLVMGSTTYAMSTMLAAFMSGLAIGAYIGGFYSDRVKNPVFVFGVIEACIAFFGLITFVVIKNLTPMYAWAFYKFNFSFHVFFAAQFLLAFFVMLIPTTLMGATFPMALKGRVKNIGEVGRDGGGLYSINSLGAVVGALAAGFVLVPFVGVKMANLFAASFNCLAAIVLIALSYNRSSVNALIAMVFISGLLSLAIFFNTQQKTMPFNFYRALAYPTKPDLTAFARTNAIVFEKENAQGVVQVFAQEDPYGGEHHYIATNGKVEGSVARMMSGDKMVYYSVDWTNQLLLAYLPLAINPEAESFFNLGLGTGTTVRAALSSPGVSSMVCVEIQPLVYEAVEAFFYPEIFTDARAKFVVADARNYLAMVQAKYDVISSEPSYPMDEGVSHLFSIEFFDLVKSRLTDKGVFVQWIPGYMLDEYDRDVMIRTFASAFPSVHVWQVLSSNDIIMMGSNAPRVIDEKRIKSAVSVMEQAGNIHADYKLLLTPEDVAKIAGVPGPLNTDDSPYLEFAATRKFLRFGEKKTGI